MAVDITTVLADLDAESAELDALVAELGPEQWSTPTPAEGWTIAHQIGHLAWTDAQSVIAATDAAAFGKVVEQAWQDPNGFVDKGAEEWSRRPGLLDTWRTGRAQLQEALKAVPEGEKVPWFGPPMSPSSMATARIMETWAHGLDVADALGVTKEPTPRIKHVAHIGVRARGFAYLVNQLTPPDEDVRVELTAPDGELWTWGAEDAAQRVTGSALDFAYVVTQRRHIDDTDIKGEGDDAKQWLSIAQAFAGAPGNGRKAGQF